MTFIEIIGRLNRIFPQTTDFDYRAISPEELWKKIYDFINRIGLLEKYDDKDLKEIRDFVTFEQKGNYRKKAVVKTNLASDYDYGFDQNNYVIKHSVLKMKEYVLNAILEKNRMKFDLITDEFDSYNRNMGPMRSLEEYIDTEEIEKYITKLLTVSKEDNDNYRFQVELFVRNVLYNYGFNPNSTELSSFKNQVNKMIDSIIFSNPNYKVEKNGEEYVEGVRANQKTIKELAMLIASAMRNSLQNRKEEEFSSLVKEKPAAEESTKETKSISTRRQEITDLSAQNDYQQELLARNRRIIEELRRMAEKEIELKSELEENNARMAGLK